MAFWLHEHRVLLALRYLAPRYKIVAITVICAVIIALWAFVLFIPARAQLEQSLRAQHDLTEQNTAMQKVADKLALLTLECAKLETQADSFDIQSGTLHESIDFLVQSLRNHDILCKNLQPEHTQTQKKEIRVYKKDAREAFEKRDFFQKEYWRFTLTGTFAQMLSFLDEILLSKRLIAFKTLSLERGDTSTINIDIVVRIASISPGSPVSPIPEPEIAQEVP